MIRPTNSASNTQPVQLNRATILQLNKTYAQDGREQEIAGALLLDDKNVSTTFSKIEGANSQTRSVSYTQDQAIQTLDTSTSNTGETKFFSTHNHNFHRGSAFVQSEQDVTQHENDITNYSSTNYDYQGALLVGADFTSSHEGIFHIKARTTEGIMQVFDYEGVQAEHLVVDGASGDLIRHSKTGTLEPEHNTADSWGLGATLGGKAIVSQDHAMAA